MSRLKQEAMARLDEATELMRTSQENEDCAVYREMNQEELESIYHNMITAMFLLEEEINQGDGQ